MTSNFRTLVLLTGVAASVLFASCSGVDTVSRPPGSTAQEMCAQLNSINIGAASIGLPTSGGVVTTSELIAPSGEARVTSANTARCQE
jgi:hypothetical protein